MLLSDFSLTLLFFLILLLFPFFLSLLLFLLFFLSCLLFLFLIFLLFLFRVLSLFGVLLRSLLSGLFNDEPFLYFLSFAPMGLFSRVINSLFLFLQWFLFFIFLSLLLINIGGIPLFFIFLRRFQLFGLSLLLFFFLFLGLDSFLLIQIVQKAKRELIRLIFLQDFIFFLIFLRLSHIFLSLQIYLLLGVWSKHSLYDSLPFCRPYQGHSFLIEPNRVPIDLTGHLSKEKLHPIKHLHLDIFLKPPLFRLAIKEAPICTAVNQNHLLCSHYQPGMAIRDRLIFYAELVLACATYGVCPEVKRQFPLLALGINGDDGNIARNLRLRH